MAVNLVQGVEGDITEVGEEETLRALEAEEEGVLRLFSSIAFTIMLLFLDMAVNPEV